MAAPPIPNWQASILRGIGAPVTPANLTFLNAWTRAEGGSAANNPFNTTQRAPGAGTYNSVGVRSYRTPQQGINATIQTLRNGRYGGIIQALRQGNDPMLAARALAVSPWGTGSLVEKILGGGTAWLPPSQAQPSAPPRVPRPYPGRPIGPNPADLTGLFNVGNEMFGLPALPGGMLASPVPAQVRRAGAATLATKNPSATAAPAAPQTSGPTIKFIEHFAAPYGLTVTATRNGNHVNNSWHYKGRAVDFAGDPARMALLARAALQHPRDFLELFYTGPGSPGFFIKNGVVYPNSQLNRGVAAEHTNHVHLAA